MSISYGVAYGAWMNFKIWFAVLAIALGVAVGCYEIFQAHWWSAVSAVLSGVVVAGFLLIGREFFEGNFIGALVILVATVAGFYGLLFESRALDLKLNEARVEAALALLQTKEVCVEIPGSREALITASQACYLQPNRDQSEWAVSAAKQIYLPQELGFADAVHSSLKTPHEDLCSAWVKLIYEKCPKAISSMRQESIQRLLRK